MPDQRNGWWPESTKNLADGGTERLDFVEDVRFQSRFPKCLAPFSESKSSPRFVLRIYKAQRAGRAPPTSQEPIAPRCVLRVFLRSGVTAWAGPNGGGTRMDVQRLSAKSAPDPILQVTENNGRNFEFLKRLQFASATYVPTTRTRPRFWTRAFGVLASPAVGTRLEAQGNRCRVWRRNRWSSRLHEIPMRRQR